MDETGGKTAPATEPRGSPSAPPESPPTVDRGATLGRYIVIERIGQGGMGVVYSAYDPALDRKVAVKLLLGEPGKTRARLLREGQALARLAHPNVVAVHDVGVIDGQVFIAMEFVDGRTVRAWLAERPRPRRRCWMCSARPDARSRRRMRSASSTAASSRRTCCSTPRGGCASSISGCPGRGRRRGRHAGGLALRA